jgi:hypothetical protein
MAGLEAYIQKVNTYATDTEDQFVSQALSATRNELIHLKYQIQDKKMILPEDVKTFIGLVDRSEALLDVSGILDSPINSHGQSK